MSSWRLLCKIDMALTNKQLETHGCIFSTVATDAVVLKYRAISTRSAHEYALYGTNFIRKSVYKDVRK